MGRRTDEKTPGQARTDYTDWERLAREAPHDQAALSDLVEALRPLLLRFTHSRGVSEVADAEDLVQHTLVRVLENIGTYDAKRAKVTTWASVILLRLLANESRDRRRQRQRLDEYGEGILAEMRNRAREQAAQPDADLMERIQTQRIREALARLPEDSRKVWELSLEDWTQQEIAEVCGIAVGTVKSRKNRSQRQLAEMIGDL